jgi:hypothetical protein
MLLWLLGKGEEVRFLGLYCDFIRIWPNRTEKSHRFIAELPVIRSENVKFPNTLLILHYKYTVKYARKYSVDTSSVKVKLFRNKSENRRWRDGMFGFHP